MKITYEVTLFEFILAENAIKKISHVEVNEDDYDNIYSEITEKGIKYNISDDWLSLDYEYGENKLSITIYCRKGFPSWEEN